MTPRTQISPPGEVGRAAPRFTLTLQELEEGPPPATARAAVLLGAAMLAGFVAWAAHFPVVERALARGEIAPDGQVQPVQHADGGVVSTLLATVGEEVVAGQVLIRLDRTTAEADLDAARAREAALALSIQRLAAAAEGRLAVLLEVDHRLPGGIRDSQEAVAEAALRLRANQLAVLDSELAGRESTLESLIAQLGPSKVARDLARAEVNTLLPMFDRGLIRRNDIHALRQTQLRLEADVTRLEGDIATARIAIAESAARREELAARIRQDALAERARAEADLAEARQLRTRAEARLARLEVTAPVAGIVKELVPRGSGSVIEPGGLVAEIVPGQGGVHASVELSADQTNGVAPGRQARVKLLSYDPTRYGSLRATVVHVSPSSFRRQDGTAFFRVRLALDDEDGARTDLRALATPGLTVLAEINIGSQSLLSWLAKPVRAAVDDAFGTR